MSILAAIIVMAIAFAWVIATAVQMADDLSDDEADGDWPFIPNCTQDPEVWTPQADRRGVVAVFDGPATSVSSLLHSTGLDHA